jgi:hypothetical protein
VAEEDSADGAREVARRERAEARQCPGQGSSDEKKTFPPTRAAADAYRRKS